MPNRSRRELLRLAGVGMLGGSASGWLQGLAAHAASDPNRRKSCILLWMSGGPSQIDTFDPKPGHPNGGEFKAIDTSVPGIRVCEHLPQLARQMEHVAIIPSMQTKEGDHQRAWKEGEPRESRLVFIGRELPEQTIRDGFERCITT